MTRRLRLALLGTVDGTRVFVTGWSSFAGTGADYVTIAYAA